MHADVASYGDRVATSLRRLLGSELVGTYFVGSVVLGGYVAGESDIDIVAICESPLPQKLMRPVADALLDPALGCPARGLEFTLYRRKTAATPTHGAAFEVNVNGGPRMPRSVHLDPSSEPWFWYVLDRAIAHRHGIAITGPPAADLFADVPRPTLLEAMTDSMAWHRTYEKATLYSVLNGCRTWRYAAQDVLGSKLDGAAWARQRWRNPALIDAAVALRHGRPAALNANQVDEFLSFVQAEIRRKQRESEPRTGG